MMRRHSATLFFAALALVFMGIHLWTGWQTAIADAAEHGQAATVGDYMKQWVRDTSENMQSELWQLSIQFAVLAGTLRFIKVQAYEEDVEKLHEKIDRIEKLLDTSDKA